MSNTSTKSSVSSTSSILPSSTIALIEKTKRKSKSKQSKREANKKNDLPPSTLIDAAKTDGQVTFEDLGIEKRLFGSALEELGWTKPTKIQTEALPIALKGNDIIALAQTGSGKTGAFALPILQDLKLCDDKQQTHGTFGVVLSPTRELAYQIEKVFKALGSGLGDLKCCTLIGGMNVVLQATALAKRPHIIVATPGRLLYHLQNTKGFSLAHVKYLVLDEADRLLNMDFEDAIDEILRFLPKKRTTFLYSATMTNKVSKLERACLRNPVKIKVSAKYESVSTLTQNYIFVPAKYKDCYLTFILNDLSTSQIIVFTDTVVNAQRITAMLNALGFAVVSIHGRLSQQKRLSALNKFVSRTSRVLIATDVASRGLDIPLVDVVINYDVPHHSKEYMHRVGRTARAGHAGRALTIVTQYDVELYQRIESLIGLKLDAFPVPDEATVLSINERVAEAQRIAVQELKDEKESRSRKRGGSDSSSIRVGSNNGKSRKKTRR